MTNLFEEYAYLENQIEMLEVKKSQLKPFIIEQMIRNGMKSYKTPLGTFTVRDIKKWEYPEEIIYLEKKVEEQIKEIKETVKVAKAKAESDETATCEITPSLSFSGLKL